MSEQNLEPGVVDIVNKISDNDRASAIDAIQDLLFAKHQMLWQLTSKL